MPHSHSRSLHTCDVIENTIDRLLRQGARISEALEQEVEYAGDKYGDAPKKDHRNSSAASGSSSLAPSEAKPKGVSSKKNPSTRSAKEISFDSDKSVPLSSLRSSDRSATPRSSQFSSRQVPRCGGKPVWTKKVNPTAPASELSHSFDIDDIPSLQYSCSKFSEGRSSRTSLARSSKSSKSCGKPTFTLPPKQSVDDIGSDMLVPPPAGVKDAVEDPSVNDAMPKSGDVYLGIQSHPCFIRDGDKLTERAARVTLTRRVNSNWIVMFYEVEDANGRKLIHLRCEVLGRLVRNVYVNGKRAD